MKNINQEQYDQIVDDIGKEFSLLLAKADEASEPLHSAKKEEHKEEHKDKEESKEAEEKKEAPKAEDHKEEEKKDEDHDEHHGYDEHDIEEMHKMYGSMNKAELKLHKEACDKHHMEKCGEMSMGKTEKETIIVPTEAVQAVKSDEVDLLKSENSAQKQEIDTLKKSMQDLVSAMTTFVSKKAPARKAITEISVIEKSEKTVEPVKLSKPEIIKVLSEKTQEPTLSKSDRDLIDNFCYGKVGVEKIQHLLK